MKINYLTMIRQWKFRLPGCLPVHIFTEPTRKKVELDAENLS